MLNLGGESSGGLTVRCHIFGKNFVYAVSLFVEMVCTTQKFPSDFWRELVGRYGSYEMVECNLSFTCEEMDKIEDLILKQRRIPSFDKVIMRVSYEDGCRIYFEDDAFVICRFSATESLLRIFAEAQDI